MSTLKVRWPDTRFEQSLPHWNAAEPEFSQINNAASTVLPHLEPYLIRVMRRARETLDPTKDAGLIADINLFVRQEANHYKLHQRYNEILYAHGYDCLKAHEQKLADDYTGFLAKRSLKFNLAYSEGFESMGAIQAEFMFKHAGLWLQHADAAIRTLWEWHLAEELEHRCVCYDLYQRLHGGYWYRMYGLFYAIKHLQGYGKRASAELLKNDRASGTIADGPSSRWREIRYRLRLGTFGLYKLCRVISPFYNPARLKMPAAAIARLAASDTA